jgi:hypothetical protein
MKFALAFSLSLLATSASAAPVTNIKTAIKIGCASIHTHLPGDDAGTCDDFVAVLRGDVWTVSQKKISAELIGGGAPAIEISQETGEVLNFYLTN